MEYNERTYKITERFVVRRWDADPKQWVLIEINPETGLVIDAVDIFPAKWQAVEWVKGA